MNMSRNNSYQNTMKTTSDNGTLLLSLDELLESLGFKIWEEFLSQFVFASLNLLSALTCSTSAWILFKKSDGTFKDPVFFYFRLISVLYLLCSLVNIPLETCFSPRFFPLSIINTYFCSALNVACLPIITFLLHFYSALDICILLTRMKIVDPFVKKNFSLSPKIISLILFFVCLIIECPIWFILKVSPLGDYYYFDSDGKMQNATFYYYTSSDFAVSSLGQLSVVFNYVFNNFFTLIVCVVLNVVSVIKYKSYLRRKKQATEKLRTETNQPAPGVNQIRKEKKERKAENNMLYMALTLSSISITYRVVLTLGYVYYFVFNSFYSNLTVTSLCFLMYTLLPLSSIFVFYFFNTLFRQEFKRMLCCSQKEAKNTHATILSLHELMNSLGEST